jgi:xanthine dehydrogenase accessory factor
LSPDLDTLVLRQAAAWQGQGVPALLVCVMQTWGSSPRPPGSLMALSAHGETVGSVSGGCIEDDLIARVREHGVKGVCQRGLPEVLRYGISADQAHRFGLPCGGTVELVLEPLQAHSRIGELLQACEARQCTERWLHLGSGEVTLRTPTPSGPGLAPQAAAGSGARTEGEHFIIPFGPRARVLLIGAGDLARFMAEMAQGLGLEVQVCDPRPEARASWALPGVKVSADMPDDLLQRIRPDARTAVVALTHDPKIDDLALIDALQSEAFYVAAIGSRRNAQLRRQRLAEHFGLSEPQLERLRSPAGLYIGSKTPAEIALSIMAELVACKNGISLPEQARVAQAKAGAVPSAA